MFWPSYEGTAELPDEYRPDDAHGEYRPLGAPGERKRRGDVDVL